MTIDEFVAQINDKQPPAPADRLAEFERAIGHPLPNDYRAFLVACNGGYLGGALRFRIPAPDNDASFSSVNHIGGFRDEYYFSLEHTRDIYEDRIPRDLIWIMDDPGGNALCLGIGAKHRGHVYFWSHEFEPDDEEWDGAVESAGNVTLVARSFTEFVNGLQRRERLADKEPTEAPRPWWKLW